MLLSQRECSAMALAIFSARSRAEVTNILDRHDLSDDDLLTGFPDLVNVVQELPDESLPDA
ncbi:hypothetical protein ACFUCQ_19665 [Streptomyces sp. NPDC057197]|uniref:hypothetical protein n=1 Tax=Streptomyces sp. NPDC057197 TaxID=3346045 RepID=UPI00363EE45E